MPEQERCVWEKSDDVLRKAAALVGRPPSSVRGGHASPSPFAAATPRAKPRISWASAAVEISFLSSSVAWRPPEAVSRQLDLPLPPPGTGRPCAP